jgi:hypothetical protein
LGGTGGTGGTRATRATPPPGKDKQSALEARPVDLQPGWNLLTQKVKEDVRSFLVFGGSARPGYGDKGKGSYSGDQKPASGKGDQKPAPDKGGKGDATKPKPTPDRK